MARKVAHASLRVLSGHTEVSAPGVPAKYCKCVAFGVGVVATSCIAPSGTFNCRRWWATGLLFEFRFAFPLDKEG